MARSYETHTFQSFYNTYTVLCAVLCSAVGTGKMVCASVPLPVFVGQGIAYNVSNVYCGFWLPPHFTMKNGFFVFKAEGQENFSNILSIYLYISYIRYIFTS